MENSLTSQKNPYKVKTQKGKAYFWCSCGASVKQPFCDGSHKKDGKFEPIKYLAEESKEIYFCGCKKTNHPPFCDGSHSKP
jgi:CDGSH-type Zn-finger protein